MITYCLNHLAVKWLAICLIVLVSLTLAFTGGDGDVDSAHYPHHPPTRTPTPTLTPTPASQPCHVVEVIFDRPEYQAGEPMRITIRVANAQGAPLVGAKVDATVTRTDASSVQAASSINLEDQSGTYDGLYTQTEIPGNYLFQFRVSDPTGTRFLPCTAERTVRVGPTSTTTPTVTITPSITPTSTVTVTPTPTITATVTPTPQLTAIVKVNPTLLTTTLCSERVTSNVTVDNVSGLVGVDLELSYDPTVIQVIDADRTRPGVQVKFDSFIVEDVSLNVVDTARGKIFFSASLLDGRSVNGPLALIGIDWRPQNVGNSAVTLVDAGVVLTGSGGQTISRTLQSGAVQVNFVPNCKTGTAALQGRTDYSGVIVANSAGEQVQTDVDGYFAIIAEDSLSLTFPGYLSGQANFNNLNISQIEGQATRLGTIIILAGDVNGDSIVDILDLAYLAQRYQSSDLTADLNADGLVDILDLALVAGNYQRQGPLTTWQ